jgi:threonine/homoserine efflux transporter RhtA
MQVNRDNLSKAEIKRYAILQALSWLLALLSFGVFLLEIPLWGKWAAMASVIGCLMGAVVFNYGRRVGIRVLWSHRFRR